MEVRDAVESDASALAAMSETSTDAMVNIVHDRTVRVAVATDEDEVNEHATDNGDATNNGDATAGDATNNGDATAGDATNNGDATDDGTEEESDEVILGFVSFDAHLDTVHVTQLAGDTAVCERLLAEPVSFARSEGMAVELIVPTADESLTAAAQHSGFEDVGTGPRFDTQPTVRFRLEP